MVRNSLSERKRKRKPFDIFAFDEEDLLLGNKAVGGGSGYSMSVTYDEKGKPVVKVQTYGDFDAAELRREIEQKYPGARIEGLEKQPLIRVIGEEEKEERKVEREEPKPEKKGEQSEKKGKKEPLIRVVE